MGPQQYIDSEGPDPFNLMFANQFKRMTGAKLRAFILKVANANPHVTFLWS